MKVDIDPGSGFCFGVKRAIERAEALLEKNSQLWCLGDIVHNRAEIDRLKERGLITINSDELKNLSDKPLMFRAHGEPPESYRLAEEKGLSLTDSTCPIVRKLQQRVKKACREQLKSGGQVVIFGNPDHPEVIGLQGQSFGKTIIMESLADIEKIDPKKPVELFSQTTRSVEDFDEIANSIRKNMANFYPGNDLPLKVHNTICGQISRRKPGIRKFAMQHDVIIFVGGRESSNAKVLFEQCRQVNSRSWFVSSPEELESTWFEDATSAGVCGATSTPSWLMQKVADEIMKITK